MLRFSRDRVGIEGGCDRDEYARGGKSSYTARMHSHSTTDLASRIRIRRADATDAAVLSVFAERIFRETFEADNDPMDLAAYLAEAFSTERQREEIVAADAIVLLVEDITGSTGSNAVTPQDTPAVTPLAAYSHVTAGEPPDSVHGPDPLELKRFYLDRAWQGSGLAQTLMRATFEAALAAGAGTVWLGVWEHNPRAIAFYRKFGFAEVGSHDFMVGRDRQTDLIMARPISPLPPL
jgi:diamine N-acetyltransferase